MIDILKKIYEGEITGDQAYDIIDEVLDKHNKDELDDPVEELNMNEYEWTAFGHGASLKVIAKWRYEGWPNRCKCGKEFDYRNFGWIVEDDELVVLDCCDE